MSAAGKSPRFVLVLSENWTMTPPGDLNALVRIAQEAEDAGVDGFHPFGQPTADELRPLVDAMSAAGRDLTELEVVGGIRGRFPDPASVADLAGAMEAIPAQLEAGYTTICFKPSQYTDDPAQVGRLCRQLVTSVAA